MAELKNLKKGDVVILRAFTGMAIGKKTVVAADAKTVTIETNKGTAKFSKKTGIQIEPAPKADRFANYIVEDDGSYDKERAAKEAAKQKKSEKKPAKKVKKPEPEEVEDEDDADEEIPAPAKVVSKKSAKKSSKKNPEPEPEDEEDDDDDDYEEVE